MDNVFLVTLGLIFLAALVGIYVQRRTRDACLKDFQRFHVTAEMEDGRRVWGVLAVFPSGLELFYKQANRDREGHEETSFVLFAQDVARIRAIYRFHDELTPKNQERRRRDVRRAWHPGPPRRAWRALRNFLNTFRDAFNQSIGVLLAQAKKGAATDPLAGQDKRLAQIGEHVIGAAANAYEPILERYIGRRVVVEAAGPDGRVEHPGILKAYTKDWLEVLDCRVAEERPLSLARPEPILLNRDMDVIVRCQPRAGDVPVLSVRVENHGAEPLRLRAVRAGAADIDWKRLVDKDVAPGAHLEIVLDDLPLAAFAGIDVNSLPEERALRAAARAAAQAPADGADGADLAHVTPLPDLDLVIGTRREADLCLPRKTAVLSHGGEPIVRWYQRAPRG